MWETCLHCNNCQLNILSNIIHHVIHIKNLKLANILWQPNYPPMFCHILKVFKSQVSSYCSSKWKFMLSYGWTLSKLKLCMVFYTVSKSSTFLEQIIWEKEKKKKNKQANKHENKGGKTMQKIWSHWFMITWCYTIFLKSVDILIGHKTWSVFVWDALLQCIQSIITFCSMWPVNLSIATQLLYTNTNSSLHM